jgi:class 3 adenylate cyclase
MALMGTTTIVLAEGRRMMRLSHELTPEQFELREYQGLLRALFEGMHGREVEASGDSVLAAYPSAKEAALAAVAARQAVTAHEWPHGRRLEISVGLHSGHGDEGVDRPGGAAAV